MGHEKTWPEMLLVNSNSTSEMEFEQTTLSLFLFVPIKANISMFFTSGSNSKNNVFGFAVCMKKARPKVGKASQPLVK